MDSKILENQIRELKNIRPRQDWAFLNKENIIKTPFIEKKGFSMTEIFYFNPKYATPLLITFFALILTLSLANDKILLIGKNNEILIPVLNKDSEFYLNLAEKKVKELEKLALENQTDKLPAAIAESKEVIRKAAQNIPSVPNDADQANKVLAKAKEIVKTGKSAEQIIGQPVIEEEKRVLASKVAQFVENGIEANQNKLAETIAQQISSVNQESLNEEQKQIFEKIKQNYQTFVRTEDYSILNQIAEDIYRLQL